LLTRLNAFSEKISILNENQSGFRKGYSTIDNIFVLYAFFELLKLKKKKLFVTFALYIFPFILFKSNLHHKPSLHTLSKAFSKFTNVTNNFFFFNFNNSKKAYRTKILSIVE
jgi:hypothetical protein